MKKPAYQTRLEDSADGKGAMVDRAKGIARSDAPYPFKELRAAQKDLRQGALTPERARRHGEAFSQALAKPRCEKARAGAKPQERLEESLLKWALAMDGPDNAPLRLAWVAGAEGAPDGARGLGLHGYWMAQALLRDDLQELDALAACGVPLSMLRSEGRDAMALAFEWNARQCAPLVAREGIANRLARLGIKDVDNNGDWPALMFNGLPANYAGAMYAGAMSWMMGWGRSLPFEIFRNASPTALRGGEQDFILLRGSSDDFFRTLLGSSTDVPKPIWAMGALRRSFASSATPRSEQCPQLLPSAAMNAWRKISSNKEAAWVESAQLEACVSTPAALSALESPASPDGAKKGPRL